MEDRLWSGDFSPKEFHKSYQILEGKQRLRFISQKVSGEALNLHLSRNYREDNDSSSCQMKSPWFCLRYFISGAFSWTMIVLSTHVQVLLDVMEITSDTQPKPARYQQPRKDEDNMIAKAETYLPRIWFVPYIQLVLCEGGHRAQSLPIWLPPSLS